MEGFSDKSNKIRKRRAITNEQLTQEYGKLPPQAVDLEEAVLGALLSEKDALTEVISFSLQVFTKRHIKKFTQLYKLFFSEAIL